MPDFNPANPGPEPSHDPTCRMPEQRLSELPADSPALGSLILRQIALGAVAAQGVSLADQVVSAVLAGVGNSFAVWRLQLRNGESLALRLTRRRIEDMPRPLKAEFAALELIPSDMGQRPLAMDESQANGLGHPWLLTNWAPGESKPPDKWNDANLTALSETLAKLHDLKYEGHGPVSGPWRSRLSILEHFTTALNWWHANHPEVADQPQLAALGRAVLSWLQPFEVDFAALRRFSFVHGDLVAGNAVFDASERCSLIDWEWAQIGDPAIDLALVGGAIAAGPSYVPLTNTQTNLLTTAYADAFGRKTGQAVDVQALDRRRRAWEMCNRYATSLHYLTLAPPGAAESTWSEAASRLLDGISALT
ncbi:MAG: aminoglycoside phosphotransferase family protein [Propionibacteriaceae bacterium]|jgi:aminoglycoside phosphotransferase (APT) family kinase protein|nr:aminoglycoside phosphotransferase family protein [Propionibacteriaceae bacterium]